MTKIENCNSSGGDNPSYLFRDVLNLWLENNRIRHKGATVIRYRYLIDRHILPILGDYRVSELTAPVVNSFLTQKLQEGRLDKHGSLSASYVSSIMLIIRSALKFAADEQMCMPLRSPIYKPASPKKELVILSIEEQRQLESYLTKELDLTGLGVLISLHTGLRIGEICALTWGDIDMKSHIIHVRHTVARVQATGNPDSGTSKLIIDVPKTKTSLRDIPISSALLPSLQRAGTMCESQYVVSECGDFVSPRTFEYRYHCLLRDCGIRQINYHGLRHTFATRCIEAGVDIKSLSEILGHSNVAITLSTYVHSSMEMKRIQLEKLVALPM